MKSLVIRSCLHRCGRKSLLLASSSSRKRCIHALAATTSHHHTPSHSPAVGSQYVSWTTTPCTTARSTLSSSFRIPGVQNALLQFCVPTRSTRSLSSSSSSSGFTAASSEDAPPSLQDQMDLEYRQHITDLLLTDNKIAVGSMPRNLILDAESALLSWAKEYSAPGFDHAWRLLLRLVEEQEAQQEQAQQNGRTEDDNDADEWDHSDDGKARRRPYFVRRFLVSRVVDCWRICWCRGNDNSEPPHNMLARLEELETRGVMIDNRAFTMIIEGLLKRGDAFEAPLLAQWILDQRIEEAEDNSNLRPDSFLLTSVIRAWAKSGRLEGPEMAEAILDLMHDLYESGWSDAAPNLVSYAAVMDAWVLHSRRRPEEATQALERLFYKMKASHVPGLEPDTYIYTHMIDAWTRSTPNSHTNPAVKAQNALGYLQEMVALFESGNDRVTPTTANFSRVIYALAKCGDSRRAEIEYNRLVELFQRTRNPQLEPDEDCQKALLTAFAKKGVADKAQRLLDEITHTAADGNARMPRRSYYIDVLVAWTNQGNVLTAATQSEKLLRRMVDLAKAGHPALMPDSITFLKVAKAWSRVRDNKEAERRVESLRRLMEEVYHNTGNKALKPNAKFIEVQVLTLCRSSDPDAPKRAEALIKEMEEAYLGGDSSMKPSRGIYTTLMQAWVRRDQHNHTAVLEIYDKLNILYSQGHPDYRPDKIVYSVLMESWALRGDPGKVQAIFDAMIEDYKRGNTAAKPDMRAFNSVLKAWSVSENPNAAQKAEIALDKIAEAGAIAGLHLVPDAYSFAEMIKIYCCNEAPDAPERADFYLRTMVEKGFQPSFSLYWAVIRRWLKRSDDKATRFAGILLEDLLAAAHSKNVRAPKAHEYRQFLASISNSSITGRNQQARKLLEKLPEGQVMPALMPARRHKNLVGS